MGIIMAATPVLERNPERSAVTRLTAKTCFRSLLANLMANVAMSWASPCGENGLADHQKGADQDHI